MVEKKRTKKKVQQTKKNQKQKKTKKKKLTNKKKLLVQYVVVKNCMTVRSIQDVQHSMQDTEYVCPVEHMAAKPDKSIDWISEERYETGIDVSLTAM